MNHNKRITISTFRYDSTLKQTEEYPAVRKRRERATCVPKFAPVEPSPLHTAVEKKVQDSRHD